MIFNPKSLMEEFLSMGFSEEESIILVREERTKRENADFKGRSEYNMKSINDLEKPLVFRKTIF